MCANIVDLRCGQKCALHVGIAEVFIHTVTGAMMLPITAVMSIDTTTQLIALFPIIDDKEQQWIDNVKNCEPLASKFHWRSLQMTILTCLCRL
jgi:hypothetical protein